MEDVLVSIIMPAYNAETTISDSIRSVKAQSYHNWELIVVNDGSIDRTSSIVEEFRKNESRIIHIKLDTNAGLPNARNVGCRVAKGELIAFLDSDDIWKQNKLQIQVGFHKRNPSIEISHTDFGTIANVARTQPIYKRLIDRKRNKKGNIYPQICYKNSIGVLTVIVKKDLLSKVNYFDESLWTMEDQDLWVRIAKTGTTFGYIDEVTAFYRISQNGISKKTGKYKRAYKHYIRKILHREKDISYNRIWRNYYRHFGTVYHKKASYRLAQLFFWKAIRLVPFDFISATTILYAAFGLFKQSVTYLNKKVFPS